MREELGSRNVSNKTVDMHSLQRLVYISIKNNIIMWFIFCSKAEKQPFPMHSVSFWDDFSVEIFIKYNTSGKHVNSFVSHCTSTVSNGNPGSHSHIYWTLHTSVQSRARSIKLDIAIMTCLVLCRHRKMSVYFLSCNIGECLFLFLDFLEMYRFIHIQPHLPYKIREVFSLLFLSPSVLLLWTEVCYICVCHVEHFLIIFCTLAFHAR